MDASMLIVGAGLLAGSVVLSFSVERLMSRLGVRPEEPEARPGGITDVVQRIDQWRHASNESDNPPR